MKNKIKNIFTSKYAVAAICIILAAIIAFFVIPGQNRKKENGIEVIKMKTIIAKGTLIKEDMLTVKVSSEAPADAVTDKAYVVGKYAVTDIYPEDFVTPAKLSSNQSENNFHKVDSRSDKYAVSVSMSRLSSSVSGKLEEGDVVTVFGYSKDNGLISLPELAALEVLAVSGSKGEDAASGSVPETVTLLASKAQAAQLITLEQGGEIHLAFAGRGEAAQALLGGAQ